MKIKVKDLDYVKNYSVTEEESINDAYYKMTNAGITKIPIVDENKKMLGILTMSDIAKEQFSDNIDKINTTYDNILKAINGKQILRFNDKIEGKLTVASYRSTTILSTIEYDSNSILIVGDRHSIIEASVNSKIKLLVIVGNLEIEEII